MTFSYPSNPRLTRYAFTAASSHSVIGVPGDDGLGLTAVMPVGGAGAASVVVVAVAVAEGGALWLALLESALRRGGRGGGVVRSTSSECAWPWALLPFVCP